MPAPDQLLLVSVTPTSVGGANLDNKCDYAPADAKVPLARSVTVHCSGPRRRDRGVARCAT
jgi:hypothetical protein